MTTPDSAKEKINKSRAVAREGAGDLGLCVVFLGWAVVVGILGLYGELVLALGLLGLFSVMFMSKFRNMKVRWAVILLQVPMQAWLIYRFLLLKGYIE